MVNVSRDIQDWDDDDPDAGFHRNRWDFWALVVKASERYQPDASEFDSIWDWFEHEYGIRIKLDMEGNVTDQFTVVDEQKYVFFLLQNK